MAGQKKIDIKSLDLYELLEIPFDATEKQIKKAYRKKALSCHPDKNPDNPKAKELFHELSEALSILADKEAKAAYDKLLSARKAAEIRRKKQDSKRLKLKDDLERREKLAAEEDNLQCEIERLRREGARLVQEAQEELARKVKEEKSKESSSSSKTGRVKLRWKLSNDQKSSNKYNVKSLTKIFRKYGEVTFVILSKKRQDSALIEFASEKAAKMAAEIEIGYFDNPLKVSLLSEEGKSVGRSLDSINSTSQYLYNDPDREKRRAEERKRLIEEMKRQDSEAT